MVILDINVNQQTTSITRIGKITKERSVSKSKAGKQCLSNKQIIELAKICKKIEDHYQFPCDIEWAFEKGKFYITQSRPITTL
jgi:pyruvate,water dikinase